LLSRTAANLNTCLAVLGTSVEHVGFTEAIRYRSDHPRPWHPGKLVCQRSRPFLEGHFLIVEPRLVLPLGLTATASCLD
jgi:hypothetical protein